MRFFYCTEGNPRMGHLNATLKEPLLFAASHHRFERERRYTMPLVKGGTL